MITLADQEALDTLHRLFHLGPRSGQEAMAYLSRRMETLSDLEDQVECGILRYETYDDE